MRKALFAAGAILLTTVTPADRITAVTKESEHHTEVAVVTTSPVTQSKKFQDLKSETEQLILETREQIIAREEALWKESFHNDLRLTAKHITFGSRMVLNDSSLLYNTRQVGYPAGNAYSLNLLSSSSVTAYELNQYLEGTGMAGLGESFILSELKTGVNALFLVSLAAHESGWGGSRIAQDKNNLFGYGAYDASPYSSAVHFSSVTEGVTFVANKLKQNYLLSSGKYYSGPTLSGVNERYSSDASWSTKIASTMNQIEQKIMSLQNTSYEVNR